MRKAITMEPHVHALLHERLLRLNALRGGMWNQRLTVPNMVELFVRHATLEKEDVISFKPSTRKPGRQKRERLV